CQSFKSFALTVLFIIMAFPFISNPFGSQRQTKTIFSDQAGFQYLVLIRQMTRSRSPAQTASKTIMGATTDPRGIYGYQIMPLEAIAIQYPLFNERAYQCCFYLLQIMSGSCSKNRPTES